MSGGSVFRISINSALTASATATALPSGCCRTFTSTAGRPSAVTMLYIGFSAITTRARFFTRTGVPFTTSTTVFSICSFESINPVTVVRYR